MKNLVEGLNPNDLGKGIVRHFVWKMKRKYRPSLWFPLYFMVYFKYNKNIIKKRSATNTSPCNCYLQGGGCQKYYLVF
jgi:hypothetical protein